MSFYYEGLLGRFGATGGGVCDCGRTHEITTRTVLVSDDALRRSAQELGRALPAGGTAWVLSDERTERAAGAAWKRLARGGLGGGGSTASSATAGSSSATAGSPRISEHILPGEPRPVPTIELVRSLAAEVREKRPALLVSVGSGVISDLVKQVSHETGLPNWCIATAPSVDAYTSATAAIRVEGYHRPLPTGISQLVACDLPTISGAPRELAFAGLGDLLAKIIGRLDWELARIVASEHYCPVISDASLGSARQALQAGRALDGNPAEAARTLTDAVLTSGFAMQAYGGSRPAASAEHTIAHFWEMAGVVENERWDLHGVLVGTASALVLAIYQRLFELLPKATVDVASRLRAFEGERSWEERLEPAMRPYLSKMREEMAKRTLDREVLSQRLCTFQARRQEVIDIGVPLLRELEEAVSLLRGLGYPFTLREIGVPGEAAMLAVRNVQYLRSRYSCFDLAYELGQLPEMEAAARRWLEGQPG